MEDEKWRENFAEGEKNRNRDGYKPYNPFGEQRTYRSYSPRPSYNRNEGGYRNNAPRDYSEGRRDSGFNREGQGSYNREGGYTRSNSYGGGYRKPQGGGYGKPRFGGQRPQQRRTSDYNPNAKYMKEWTKMCQAYCDKIDAKLLFVNQNHFGCEMPDGELRRICADELAVLAATKQLFSVKLSGAKMKMWSKSCE